MTTQPCSTTGERAAKRRPASSRDSGFSFVEVVVTIVLVGIVMLPILAAVRTAITASARSRSSAQIETVIVNAADRVNRAPKECDYLVYVQSAVRAQGWEPDRVTGFKQEHFVPPALVSDPGTWAPGGCIADEPTDLLVQRVTMTITSPDGRVSRTIQVVKSDV